MPKARLFYNIKLMFFKLGTILCAAVFAALAACAPETSAAQSVFRIAVGGKFVDAEIACTPFEKAQGLMHRDSLPENGAMVFVLGAPQRASFWMKDTRIPLDIAFVDGDGTITEIRKMYPFDLNTVDSASARTEFCVETNSGWFEKNAVKAGDKLDLDAVKRAVERRAKK